MISSVASSGISLGPVKAILSLPTPLSFFVFVMKKVHRVWQACQKYYDVFGEIEWKKVGKSKESYQKLSSAFWKKCAGYIASFGLSYVPGGKYLPYSILVTRRVVDTILYQQELSENFQEWKYAFTKPMSFKRPSFETFVESKWRRVFSKNIALTLQEVWQRVVLIALATFEVLKSVFRFAMSIWDLCEVFSEGVQNQSASDIFINISAIKKKAPRYAIKVQLPRNAAIKQRNKASQTLTVCSPRKAKELVEHNKDYIIKIFDLMGSSGSLVSYNWLIGSVDRQIELLKWVPV